MTIRKRPFLPPPALLAVVAILAAACAPGPARAGEKAGGPPPAPAPAEAEDGAAEAEEEQELDPETRKILERMDETHGTLRSLTTPYRQRRKVRISKRLRKSRGVLTIRKEGPKKGMKVLFDTKEPFRSKVLFTEEEVVFFDQETGEVKRRDPSQGGVRPSEIWVLGRPVSTILDHYLVRRLPLSEEEAWEPREDEDEEEREERPPDYAAKLELVPKAKKIRKWIKRILVWLRPGDALGTKVRLVDRRGDWQEFLFDAEEMEINPELDEDVFEIKD